jgi:hypothetical protein
VPALKHNIPFCGMTIVPGVLAPKSSVGNSKILLQIEKGGGEQSWGREREGQQESEETWIPTTTFGISIILYIYIVTKLSVCQCILHLDFILSNYDV